MMRSTFAGFTTATLALSASHRALEVTGQNIANINTDRKSTRLNSSHP